MGRKSLARKSVSRKSLARKSVARKSLSRKSIARKKSESSRNSRRGTKRTMSKMIVEYTAEKISSLLKEIPDGQSPIDITMPIVVKVKLPPLVWDNLNSKPLSLVITNTTHSDWPEGVWPSVTGGPLESEFLFSQLHFHWGTEDTEGSEHAVNGSKFPMEGHIVFFKKDYKTHDEARNQVDGIIIFVNFYEVGSLDPLVPSNVQSAFPKVQDQIDGDISTNYVAQHLRDIRQPYLQKSLELIPISTFLEPILDDYLLYFGLMKYKCTHGILWFISRKPLIISKKELDKFREVKQTARELVAPNFRELKEPLERTVFMVNPTRNLESVLFESLVKGKRQSVKSVSRKSMKKPSIKRKSMKRQSVKRKSMKRQSVKRQSVKRKSMKRQSTKK